MKQLLIHHSLPAQYSNNGVYDAYDYYVTFRLLGALADYTFTDNIAAKNIALGNGSPAQIDMGSQLTPLSVTDNPSPIYQESIYTNPCTNIRNERQSFCQLILGIEDKTHENNRIGIYPNPTFGILKINPKIIYQDLEISVFTMTGHKILTVKNKTDIDISHLAIATYFVTINIDGIVEVEKIMKIE